MDGIQEKKAVIILEEGESYHLILPVSLLPSGVKEGAILEITMKLNEEERLRRKEKGEDLISRLRKKNT